MSSQPPYEDFRPSVPPTQYASPYAPPPAGFQVPPSTNPYTQPTSGPYAPPPVNPYTQAPYGQPPSNPYTQPQPDLYHQPATSYGQQQNVNLFYAQPVHEQNQSLPVISLILGLASIFFFWLPFLSWPFSVLGVILPAVRLRTSPQKGLLLAGLILSATGLLMAICTRAFLSAV